MPPKPPLLKTTTMSPPGAFFATCATIESTSGRWAAFLPEVAGCLVHVAGRILGIRAGDFEQPVAGCVGAGPLLANPDR